MIFDPMELIEFSAVKAVVMPYDIYEATVDATIPATYFYESSEVDPDKTGPEYWLIVEDPIRYHIFSIKSNYYPYLLEEHLNARLQTSNFLWPSVVPPWTMKHAGYLRCKQVNHGKFFLLPLLSNLGDYQLNTFQDMTDR